MTAGHISPLGGSAQASKLHQRLRGVPPPASASPSRAGRCTSSQLGHHTQSHHSRGKATLFPAQTSRLCHASQLFQALVSCILQGIHTTSAQFHGIWSCASCPTADIWMKHARRRDGGSLSSVGWVGCSEDPNKKKNRFLVLRQRRFFRKLANALGGFDSWRAWSSVSSTDGSGGTL